MSVEEVLNSIRILGIAPAWPDQPHANAPIIDRLILEVQAEMPCYTYDPDNPHSNFTCREQVTHPEDWCPKCKAQEALKEHVPA